MRFSLIGYGVSLKAILKFIKNKKMGDVFVSEKGMLSNKDKDELSRFNVEYEEGGNTSKASKADVVVYSPSVRPDNDVLNAARRNGAQVMGEMEFSWQYTISPFDPQVVAVSGSNGKTTTVSLLDHILECAKVSHFTGGNIGVPSIKYDGSPIAVFEMSSFQLMGIEDFHANIGAILNISPNHLDWHRDMNEYVRAKMRLSTSDVFLYNADSEFIPESDGITISKDFGDVFIDEESMEFWVDGTQYTILNSKLKGIHNLYNAAFSAMIAALLQVSPENIQKGIETFSPLAHRQELVATIDGISYVNDSKSTTSDSTIMALRNFDSSIVIIGGRPKEKDYSKLANEIKKRAKFAIIMGEMIPMMEGKLKEMPHENAYDLQEAVDISQKVAKEGDVVLFSPAATSFDMFKNYKERGEAFKGIVLNAKRRV
jgi:UDP-N-acetylmuramoylalanine--D-glutamate ligase